MLQCLLCLPQRAKQSSCQRFLSLIQSGSLSVSFPSASVPAHKHPPLFFLSQKVPPLQLTLFPSPVESLITAGFKVDKVLLASLKDRLQWKRQDTILWRVADYYSPRGFVYVLFKMRVLLSQADTWLIPPSQWPDPNPWHKTWHLN